MEIKYPGTDQGTPKGNFGALKRQGILLAFLVTPAVILFLAACGQRPEQQPKRIAQQAIIPAQFVGNAACAQCHPAEFQAHLHSHHALALRPMDRRSLGGQAPPTGHIPNTDYVMTAQGDGFRFGRVGEQANPIQLAFGSGKSGMAFAAVLTEDVLAEVRISYFPPQRKWFITPGQQDLPPRSLGNITQGEHARQCLGCHTVTLPEHGLMPEQKFMGVGCEACHGPGGAHIAAMRAGDTAHVSMERLGAWGGKRINELCGRCHRTEREVLDKNLSLEHTDLFQAYGLEQSRCFRESQDRLTCLTCHDPHTDVATDENKYTAACLRCHSAPESGKSARLVNAKVCPVNPTRHCVGCHMPKRSEPVFPGSPRRVADHFIRVHREGNSESAAALLP
ncbi:MAG TPA: multiheme c-type cytochrome [Chthonomonadaceae bacterium]|nr:multiheme c-type cytochrome [Chthonomonadaceae bacterium]